MTEAEQVYEGLRTLALDLRRSSSVLAHALWNRVDHDLWSMTRNPWLILATLSKIRIAELAADAEFCELLRARLQVRTEDLARKTWFEATQEDKQLSHVAYFSMEFGLSEALPIYSGGLGILAGDHLKASSDLGVPVVAVGLLYGQGYFRQLVDRDGGQLEYFPYNDPGQLPIMQTCDGAGIPLLFDFNFPGRPMKLRVWQAQVGRVTLYLLDSNDLRNDPRDRVITSELYGGGSERRLLQEIVLGIGGLQVLEKLGIQPEVCHLNEGHAAFAILERTRRIMQQLGCSFNQALIVSRGGTLFTTHTPVPAGFDRFDPGLVASHMAKYADQLGIGIEGLLTLGRANPRDPAEPLNMAYLAVRGSTAINGVSKLHGEVSRELLAHLFPRWPLNEIPVGSVTNGVHIPSWLSPEADDLWTRIAGHHHWLAPLETIQAGFRNISDEELWAFRCLGRHRLVKYVRHRLSAAVLRDEVLTLGFARRFATYKRPDLLLYDPDRLVRLLTNTERPVQLVLAGKAHPADQPAKEIVRRWHAFIRRPEVQGKIVFIPDYDILLAERLVQGVDVWLNTPRRPYEASGTSGMKILANGGLNLSELDGWWAEAYRPDVGWALGDRQRHDGDSTWDAQEAETLFRLLEQEIVPAFYSRDAHGLPGQWIERIRQSMAQLTGIFSTNRMVREYAETYYLPLAKRYQGRLKEGGRDLLQWQQRIREQFATARFGALHAERSGTSTLIKVEVFFGDLDPAAVHVELYATDGTESRIPMTRGDKVDKGYVYLAHIPGGADPAHVTARMVPRHPDLLVPLEVPQILWQR
jgi:glycogen phosphorylase